MFWLALFLSLVLPLASLPYLASKDIEFTESSVRWSCALFFVVCLVNAMWYQVQKALPETPRCLWISLAVAIGLLGAYGLALYRELPDFTSFTADQWKFLGAKVAVVAAAMLISGLGSWLAGVNWNVCFAVPLMFVGGMMALGAAGIVMLSHEGISYPSIGRVTFFGALLIGLVQSWAAYETCAVSVEEPAGRAKEPASDGTRKLAVILHGIGGPHYTDELFELVSTTLPDHDVVRLRYLNDTRLISSLSNANAVDIAVQIDARISEVFDVEDGETPYSEVVLVGHSMGAVLLRKAYLHGQHACSEESLRRSYEGDPSGWTKAVKRFVLLAGLNRGININGQRPSDMSAPKHLSLWALMWVGDLFEVARLPREMESGAPFIANLRLDWINHFHRLNRGLGKQDAPPQPPLLVHVRGDIDDVVSDNDASDLEAIGAENNTFHVLEVRGTGHADIMKLGTVEHCDDPQPDPVEANQASESVAVERPIEPDRDLDMRCFRRRKVVEALTQSDFPSRPVSARPDTDVKHAIFVVHGIRDFGRWSSRFESELTDQATKANLPRESWRIFSPRYGYFGMGPFLFASERQNHVRWLMDEMTEIKAHYPNAEFDYVGHSNGSYLLAKALEDYDSLNMRSVVFAGCVVHGKYDWNDKFAQPRAGNETAEETAPSGQVRRVVNLAADNDWVVALFPRTYELIGLDRLPNNPVGWSGFFGFRDGQWPRQPAEYSWGGLWLDDADAAETEWKGVDEEKLGVVNIQIKGGHSAFQDHIPRISEYLMLTASSDAIANEANDDHSREEASQKVEEISSRVDGVLEAIDAEEKVTERFWLYRLCLTPPFALILIAAVVVALGVFLVAPARQYSVHVGFAYIGLVIWLLHKL